MRTQAEALGYFRERFVRSRPATRFAARLMTLRAWDEAHGGVWRLYGYDGIPAADDPVWVVAVMIEGGVSLAEYGLADPDIGSNPGVYAVFTAGNGQLCEVGGLNEELFQRIDELVSQPLVVERTPRYTYPDAT